MAEERALAVAAAAALGEEVAQLRRVAGRAVGVAGGLNMEYLKHVALQYLSSRDQVIEGVCQGGEQSPPNSDAPLPLYPSTSATH